MGRRRKARELLVQAIYAAEVGQVPLPESIAVQMERRNPGPDARAYVKRIATLYAEHGSGLDAEIDEALVGWSPERVGVVERAILRLALLEMKHARDVPPRVVVNEALELARTFSTEDAARFVNGVLDRFLVDRPWDVPAPDSD